MPNYVRDHCLHKRHTSHARICTRFTHLHAVFRAITKRINCADDIQNQYARVVAKLQSLDVRSRHKYIKYATIYEVAEKNHPDMTSDSMHTKCIHGRREETRIRMRPRTNTKRVSLTVCLSLHIAGAPWLVRRGISVHIGHRRLYISLHNHVLRQQLCDGMRDEADSERNY